MKIADLYEEITDHDRFKFTCGSCMLMAWTLHRKLGWDIGGIGRDFNERGEPEELVHAWVEKGNVAIDVLGPNEKGTVIEHWLEEAAHMGIEDAAYYKFNPAFFKRFIDDHEWGPRQEERRAMWRRAIEIVRWLKDEHPEMLS